MHPSPSLFETLFDRPAPAEELPVNIRTGQHAGIRITDGFARGKVIVGRCSATPALIAMKIATAGQGVRVRVRLRFDWRSVRWWASRVPGGTQTGGRRPRLVLLHSQNRLRYAAVLTRHRDGTTAHAAGACATFDLRPYEVPEDGLLIVDLLEPTAIQTDQLGDRVAELPMVGLQIDGIEVAALPEGEPGPAPVPPPAGHAMDAVACAETGAATWGDLPDTDRRRHRSGLFVVNPHLVPGSATAGIRLAISVQRPPIRQRLGPLRRRVAGKARRLLKTRIPRSALDRLRGVRAVLRGPRPSAAPTVRKPVPLPPVLPAVLPSALPASAIIARATNIASGRRLPVTVLPGAAGTVELRVGGPLDGPVMLQVESTARAYRLYGFQLVELARHPLPTPRARA